MNEQARRAVEILKQIQFTPMDEAERILSADLKDFLNNPTKSNAAALLEKLRQEADSFGYQESLERRDKATRQVLDMLLRPYVETHELAYTLYEYIKEVIES
jgi:excinuclease UvrABC nuclease subunit